MNIPCVFKRHLLRVSVVCSVWGLYETVINNGINCSASYNRSHFILIVVGLYFLTWKHSQDIVKKCKIRLQNNHMPWSHWLQQNKLKTINPWDCSPAIKVPYTKKDLEWCTAKCHLWGMRWKASFIVLLLYGLKYFQTEFICVSFMYVSKFKKEYFKNENNEEILHYFLWKIISRV